MSRLTPRNLTDDEFIETEQLIRKLQRCDLGNWDQNFVDDMEKRLANFGNSAVITGRQWEQLERMKGQYL